MSQNQNFARVYSDYAVFGGRDKDRLTVQIHWPHFVLRRSEQQSEFYVNAPSIFRIMWGGEILVAVSLLGFGIGFVLEPAAPLPGSEGAR